MRCYFSVAFVLIRHSLAKCQIWICKSFHNFTQQIAVIFTVDLIYYFGSFLCSSVTILFCYCFVAALSIRYPVDLLLFIIPYFTLFSRCSSYKLFHLSVMVGLPILIGIYYIHVAHNITCSLIYLFGFPVQLHQQKTSCCFVKRPKPFQNNLFNSATYSSIFSVGFWSLKLNLATYTSGVSITLNWLVISLMTSLQLLR